MARDIPNQPYNYIPDLYQQYATNEADKFASILGEVDNNYGSEFALGSNNPICQMPVSEFNQNENGTLKITDDGTVKSHDVIADDKVNGKDGFNVSQIYNMIPWNNWYDSMKGDRAVKNLVYGDTSQDPFARLIGDVSGSKKAAAYNTVWSNQQDFSGIRNNYNLLNAWNPNSLQQTYADQGWGRRVLDNLEASGQGAAKGASFGGPWGALIGGIAGGLANIGSQVIGYNQRENINKAIKTANQNTINSYYTTARNNDKRQLRANMSNSIVQNKFGMGTKHYKYGGNLMRGNIFDEGGEMGGFNSFGNGVDMFNVGGSHEENMYGGIPQGMAQDGEMNYVQEGEVKYNDYIYSNELTANKQLLEKYHLPKRYAGKDIATIADKLQEDSEERPNDSISKKTLDINMERLKGLQEEVKQKKQEAEIEAMFAQMSPQEKAMLLQQAIGNQQGGAYDEYQQQMGYGDEMSPEEQAYAEQGAIHGAPMEEGMPYAEGGILIKPSKRGTFTAAATKHGMGVQEFANQVLAHKDNYSPAMVKKANFARNFGGHKHADGGSLNEFYNPAGLPIYAFGGHLFDGGGDVRNRILRSIGATTMSDLKKWFDDNYGTYDYDFDDENTWEQLIKDTKFQQALAKTNPDIAFAIKNGQYNFDTYKPDALSSTTDVSFADPLTASWSQAVNQVPEAWRTSKDDAFLELVERYGIDEVMKWDRVTFRNRLHEMPSFIKTTEWLKKDKANALQYLSMMAEQKDAKGKLTPQAKHALKYIKAKEGGGYEWIDDKVDWNEDRYNVVFAPREDMYPGSYHKSNKELSKERNKVVKKYLRKPDGSYTEILTDVPTNYNKRGDTLTWSLPDSDYEYEFYDEPVTKPETKDEEVKAKPNPYIPKPYYDWIPTAYAGKMFLNDLRGPDFTLGTQLRDIAGDFRYTAPGGLTRERYFYIDPHTNANREAGLLAGMLRSNSNHTNRATQAAENIAIKNTSDNAIAKQDRADQELNFANMLKVDDFNNNNAKTELGYWDNAENRNQKVDELRASYRAMAANADDQSISNWNKMRDRDWQAMLQYQADMDKEQRNRDFILANADLFNAPEDFEGRMPQYYSTPWGWWGRNR